jgi:protein-tyrosine-phosphatase
MLNQMPIDDVDRLYYTSIYIDAKKSDVSMSLNNRDAQSPDLLKLLANDLRWTILTTLAHSDRRVQELVALAGQPQNLVSYHLRQLRNRKLVSERRSSADSRDVYYSINLDELRADYLAAGAALHPALSEPEATPQARSGEPARVLFLCTHNSARSQMAEGILRHITAGRVVALSAGSAPSQLHPFAAQVLAARGIDIGAQRPKHLDEFMGQHFDYIVTVCDRVREACPTFPGDPERIHWSFPDPAATEGPPDVQIAAFEQIARQLATRIRYLLTLIEREKGFPI